MYLKFSIILNTRSINFDIIKSIHKDSLKIKWSNSYIISYFQSMFRAQFFHFKKIILLDLLPLADLTNSKISLNTL